MSPKFALGALAVLLLAWGVQSRALLQPAALPGAQDCVSATSVPIADLNVTLCEWLR